MKLPNTAYGVFYDKGVIYYQPRFSPNSAEKEIHLPEWMIRLITSLIEKGFAAGQKDIRNKVKELFVLK